MQLGGQQPTQGGRLERGDREIEVLVATVDANAGDAAALVADEPFDAGAEADVDAELARALGGGEHKRFVAALQAAHALARVTPVAGGAHAVGAGPEVGGGQLAVVGVEARVEQRPPDALHDVAPAVAREPAFEGLALQ